MLSDFGSYNWKHILSSGFASENLPVTFSKQQIGTVQRKQSKRFCTTLGQMWNAVYVSNRSATVLILPSYLYYVQFNTLLSLSLKLICNPGTGMSRSQEFLIKYISDCHL